MTATNIYILLINLFVQLYISMEIQQQQEKLTGLHQENKRVGKYTYRKSKYVAIKATSKSYNCNVCYMPWIYPCRITIAAKRIIIIISSEREIRFCTMPIEDVSVRLKFTDLIFAPIQVNFTLASVISNVFRKIVICPSV